MKPIRIKMTHSLVNSYGLLPQLEILKSDIAQTSQLTAFHHPDYIKYLQTWITPPQHGLFLQDNYLKSSFVKDTSLGSVFRVNQIPDCPGFPGLYRFCELAAGSSILAADFLMTGQNDVVINWAGGYHHAKRCEASGFCYINDIVICILELLKVHKRVLYLDIDVHHGDGVE